MNRASDYESDALVGDWSASRRSVTDFSGGEHIPQELKDPCEAKCWSFPSLFCLYKS